MNDKLSQIPVENWTPEQVERFTNGMMKMIQNMDEMKMLSDRELVEAVIEKVWGQMILGGEQETLLDELITRYEKRSGIKRDDEGKIVEGGESDPDSDAEWDRIEKMTPEEVTAELEAAGYTKEKITKMSDEAYQKFSELLKKKNEIDTQETK